MGPLLAILMLVAGEPEQACKPLVDVLESMDIEFRRMPHEAVQPMLMFHNSSPPVSEDKFGSAAFATTKEGVGLILWLDGDKVCQRDIIPPAAWARLLPLITGSGV